METLRLVTIGFTRKSAETFFTLLSDAGVKWVIDVRLNNVSQRAGFARRDDLRHFLKAICGIDYLHMPELAPTREILDTFRKSKTGWPRYETEFVQLLDLRQVETKVPRALPSAPCGRIPAGQMERHQRPSPGMNRGSPMNPGAQTGWAGLSGCHGPEDDGPYFLSAR